MKILYIGPDYAGSNGTCWRDAFLRLGHDVRTVDSEKEFPLPISLFARLFRKLSGKPSRDSVRLFNSQIIAAHRDFKPEMTFFIQARNVLPEILDETGKNSLNFVYMNDDMFNPANQSFTFKDAIQRMHCILTTKSYNVEEFHQAGAPLAVYIPNAYDPEIHFPATTTKNDEASYGGDIGFIGTFRQDRADYLTNILNQLPDLRFNIWGGGWSKVHRPMYWHKRNRWQRLVQSIRGKELWCGEMGKAMRLNKICLGLLNHHNRDLHTSRSFEIPACKGFMLAERTDEHRAYFEEDREAVYFDSLEELVDKTRYYVTHDRERERITEAGYQRCVRSNYQYVDRAKTAIEYYWRLI